MCIFIPVYINDFYRCKLLTVRFRGVNPGAMRVFAWTVFGKRGLNGAHAPSQRPRQNHRMHKDVLFLDHIRLSRYILKPITNKKAKKGMQDFGHALLSSKPRQPNFLGVNALRQNQFKTQRQCQAFFGEA
jgi:hypothetical protein